MAANAGAGGNERSRRWAGGGAGVPAPPQPPQGVQEAGEELEEEAALGEGEAGRRPLRTRSWRPSRRGVREMEEEAEKLKELQNEVEKQMNMSPPPGNAGPVIMSLEEKMEADARSIYVGNVDYGATAEELEAHFPRLRLRQPRHHPVRQVQRAPQRVGDDVSGDGQRFAYIEFSDKESVRTSMALDESLFRGRQIKVIPKRTNRPGISSTDRGFPRGRFRGRGGAHGARSRFYAGYRPRGRGYRGRARATSWYNPY
ncbi:hypothetical protein Q9966_016114 [Columba livia]|nr:hypothetical protein Q9966_016114 [Columba livia]